MAFQYRIQAKQLGDLASRYEIEAQVHATQSGQDSEEAKRSREMAKKLRSSAEAADQQAREYQSRLPHGRVY